MVSRIKHRKKFMKVIFVVFLIIVAFLAIVYINHKICLGKESPLFIPCGQTVEVDGHAMSIYTEGTGDKTIVFLSGGGTCSPILDFKSLYSLLSDKYKIVVVEKFGYGFSEIVDKERNIESVLEDTRTALKEVGMEAPYVLCPHSMSGIEALYWAQQYPEEVSAIIGLDMAAPAAYNDYKINMPILKLGQFAASIGITRLIPGISESDAIKYGTLSEDEKELYKAVFYRRTATTTMLNEVACIKESARKVDEFGAPQVPMLLFVSNGHGTGWDKEAWLNYQKDYLKNVEYGRMIEFDCPHYIHDYEYQKISECMDAFLNE